MNCKKKLRSFYAGLLSASESGYGDGPRQNLAKFSGKYLHRFRILKQMFNDKLLSQICTMTCSENLIENCV